jgi:hypothetical protein
LVPGSRRVDSRPDTPDVMHDNLDLVADRSTLTGEHVAIYVDT